MTMENLEKQKMLEGSREQAREYKENLKGKQETLEMFKRLREREGEYQLPPEAIKYFAEQSKWFEEDRGVRPGSEYDRAEKLCRIIVRPKDLNNKDLSKHNFGIKRVLYRELFLRSQLRYEDKDESYKFKMAFRSFFGPLLYYEDQDQKAMRLNEEREKLIVEQNKLMTDKSIIRKDKNRRLGEISQEIRKIKNDPNYSARFREHIDNLPYFIPNCQQKFEKFKKSHPEEPESALKEKFIIKEVTDILEELYQSLYQMFKKKYLDKKSPKEKL